MPGDPPAQFTVGAATGLLTEMTDAPPPGAREAILAPLAAYSEARAGPSRARPLVILLREPGAEAVIGGLWGRTSWGWLFVELLCVPEGHRHRGVGEDMLRRAEAEALRRGCVGARLDTYSFQAPGFYRKLGYELVGTIEDHPPGHSRHFLRKRLAPA